MNDFWKKEQKKYKVVIFRIISESFRLHTFNIVTDDTGGRICSNIDCNFLYYLSGAWIFVDKVYK